MAHPAHLPPESTSGSNVLREAPSADLGRTKTSPELSGLFHKIHRNWQDYGWNVTLRKTLAYLIRSIYFRQIYRIYRIDLGEVGSPSELSVNPLTLRASKWSPRPTDTKPPVEQGVHNFTFKILTAENGDAISQVEATAEWLRGRLQGAIAAGQPCLVALDGDRVAGFNLISLDRATLTLVNLTRRLRPACAWSEHIAVAKEYRRTGLGAQLRFRIFRELQRRGVRRLYGGALLSNTASLNLARSVGFEEIADIHYRKFFFHEKWRYKRVRG